jgi:dihydrofolate synthase/folylpolyglutamate synthase
MSEARKTVEEIAAQRKASLTQIGRDYIFKQIKSSLDRQTLMLKSSKTSEQTWLEIGLLGRHQAENASTAYIALQHVREQGIPISERAIHDGFAQTKWPARFEILRQDPPLIVDSAHNPDSARKLRQTVEELFPGHPMVLIFGVSEDKNIIGMIKELQSGTIQFICSQSTHPRAMDADELMKLVKPFDIPVVAINNVGVALDEAIKIASDDAVVLVTGSIFVAATARIAWFEKMKPDMAK